MYDTIKDYFIMCETKEEAVKLQNKYKGFERFLNKDLI